MQGAEFRTLGSVAAGGGKQPTFCTARAQHGHSTGTAHGLPPICGSNDINRWAPPQLQCLLSRCSRIKLEMPTFKIIR